MSSSAPASHPKWSWYGAVPMTTCPDFPRPEPLKRLVSKTDKYGNLGREFVKCLSKPHAGREGKMLKKCWHFEWIDEYSESLKFEGSIDFSGGATRDLNLLLPVENLGSYIDIGADRAVPTTGNVPNAELPVELKGKLKKINKHLRQMIDLKKQANMMAGGFYSYIICMSLFYLLFIRN